MTTSLHQDLPGSQKSVVTNHRTNPALNRNVVLLGVGARVLAPMRTGGSTIEVRDDPGYMSTQRSLPLYERNLRTARWAGRCVVYPGIVFGTYAVTSTLFRVARRAKRDRQRCGVPRQA